MIIVVKQNKKYLLIFLLILFFGLLSTAAVNIIIDPAGIFMLVDKEGFNSRKTELMRGGGRRDKAITLKLKEFDTVILGSSRTEIGINSRSPAFGNMKVYNAALPDTHMGEIHSVFEFIRKKTKTKRIIIGLDMLLFTTPSGTRGDFNESLFAADSPFKVLYNIFSLDEFLRSIDTLRDNLKGKEARYSKLGHRKKFNIFKKVNNQRSFFNRKLSKSFRFFAIADPPIKYHPERLEFIRSIIEESRAAGIDLILFISPVHMRQMEFFLITSLMDEYIRWQRDLTDILSNYPEVKLWDFSGANRVNTESIPPLEDTTTIMRWFWDASHYNNPLGDIIIKRLLGQEVSEPEYAGFGVLINNENIERHLAEKLKARKEYRLKYPEEIDEIEELWRKAKGR